jgi:hypothetical protein
LFAGGQHLGADYLLADVGSSVIFVTKQAVWDHLEFKKGKVSESKEEG